MELPRNDFKRAIAEGRRQIGFWLSLGSAAVAEVVAGTRYDWVMIDTEHAPNDSYQVMQLLQALNGSTATPVAKRDAASRNDAGLARCISVSARI